MTIQEEFLEWIKYNYPSQKMDEPPDDWDMKTEFYYRPNINSTLQYGPIKIKDVPEKFIKDNA